MKNEFLRLIDFKGGDITFNDFDIDPTIPFCEQELSLQQGLLQVEYGSYMVDVGWLPSLNPKGRFVIYLIHNYDWVNIVHETEAKNFVELRGRLQEMIDYAVVLLSHVHA